VRGTFALRDGAIDVAEPVTASAVRARIAASTFTTGNNARDTAVLSARLLDTQNHPTITFTSTALVEDAGRWLLRGELAVRGVTCPVEASIGTVSVGDGTLAASATLTVDRYAFGITGYRGLAARRLTVTLRIEAKRQLP
jgi:polyisoprenoid-binding protein YceI